MYYIIFSSSQRYSQFLVLYNSLMRHDANCRIILITVDNIPPPFGESKNLRIINRPTEMSNLGKHRIKVLLEILNTYPDIPYLTLLGADCYMVSPPTALQEVVNQYDVILTPHFADLLDTFNNPITVNQVHLAGLYNSDVTSFRNTSNTKNILNWIISMPFAMNIPQGFFQEQTYFSFIPVFFKNILMFKDKAYNIAYWNINQRLFNFNEVYLVDKAPAVITHFSGYNSPAQMSIYHAGPPATGDVLKLYTEYSNELQKYKTNLS